LGNRAVPATSTPASEWVPLPKVEGSNEIFFTGISISPSLDTLTDHSFQLFLLKESAKLLSPSKGPDSLAVLTHVLGDVSEKGEVPGLARRLIESYHDPDSKGGRKKSKKSKRTKKSKKSRRRKSGKRLSKKLK
jgi:hypothetical protein